MEVLKAILAALVGLLVIFACIAWAIAAVLGPLAVGNRRRAGAAGNYQAVCAVPAGLKGAGL